MTTKNKKIYYQNYKNNLKLLALTVLLLSLDFY